PLVGRILISVIFLLSGIEKLMTWHGSAAFLASKGFPIADVMLAGAVVVEILGALCLITGFQTRIAALIMFLYLIPATLMFHNFWAMQGAMRADNQGHFLKNLAIMGGLLMVAAYGPGRLSIDASRAKV
ncbi:MAG: DoxX family protein, partial [Candidatus Acidiferrales bacterium]